MKKQLFTFVMMLALVIITSGAFAQGTYLTPYPGGTYTYTLDQIAVIQQGTAVVSFTGMSKSWSLLNTKDQAGTLTAAGTSVTIKTSSTKFIFDITYDSDETPGDKTLKVLLTDGTNGCSNFIELKVTVQQKPALNLAIAASETDYCQKTTTTPADNTAASKDQSNSFKFTVTPSVTNVATAYNYDYTINLPTAASTGLTGYTITKTAGGGTYDPSTGKVSKSGTIGSDATPDEFTITFTTTTGIAPVAVIGSLSAAPSLKVTAGNVAYTGTITAPTSVTVNVKTMPSIGTFN